MQIVFMTGLGFLLGSLPFSVWLGRLFLRLDIRQTGADRNPGAANAFRAGGLRLGLLVLVLDYLKGAVPVGLAHYSLGITGWPLLPVALAPVLGHAFSPFLRFRGGKGLTVTFGSWTGVLLPQGPLVLGLFFTLFYLLLSTDAWAVTFAMLAFLLFLLATGEGLPVLAIWLGNMLLLVSRHWGEFRLPIRLRLPIARH